MAALPEASVSQRQNPKRKNPIDLYVGERIGVRRRKLGLSQLDLATRLGLLKEQVQKYEAGKDRISASCLYEISRVLKVTPGHFYKGFQQNNEPRPLKLSIQLDFINSIQKIMQKDIPEPQKNQLLLALYNLVKASTTDSTTQVKIPSPMPRKKAAKLSEIRADEFVERANKLLTARRIMIGMSQQNLSGLLPAGTTSHVHYIEKGVIKLTPSYMIEKSFAMGMTVEELFDGIEQNPESPIRHPEATYRFAKNIRSIENEKVLGALHALVKVYAAPGNG